MRSHGLSRPEKGARKGSTLSLRARHETVLSQDLGTVLGRIRPIGLRRRHNTVRSHGLSRHENGA